MQNADLLLQELGGEEGCAREVPTRTIETQNKAEFDRIAAHAEHDGDRRRCRGFGLFCREAPAAAAMTVTRRRTNSSASAGSSAYCCVERYSIVTLRPSMRPPSLNPWRKAATELMPEVSRIPMTGSDACCARPMTGHAPAPPTSVMNSRRLMCVLTSARGEHPTTLRCRVVQHSKVDRRMVEMGHKPRRRWGPGASLCPQCLQSR